MLILTLTVQVYIVAGGWGSSRLASTEILEKEGGTSWQYVASLPSARFGPRGLGLDHGRFMVTGQCWTILYHHNFIILTLDALQVAMMEASSPTWLSTSLKRTSGL